MENFCGEKILNIILSNKEIYHLSNKEKNLT